MIEYDEEKLKKFVSDYRQLIINCNIDGLYTQFVKNKNAARVRSTLTQFLLDCGINPLEFCKKINENMFECVSVPDKFEDLKIGDKVEKICEGAFCLCSGLGKIYIPGNVKIIDSHALAYSSVKEVYIDNGVETIANAAFIGCDGLEELNIPDSVTHIGRWAFKKCENLKKIYATKDLDLSEAELPIDCKIIRR